MKIDKNSYGTLAFVVLVCVLLSLLAFWLVSIKAVCWFVVAASVVFCTWQFFFFRVPYRTFEDADESKVLSSADGEVVITDSCFENEFLKKECLRVCVYMNFFDVHANFWPVSGKVSYYKYHPGEHYLAFKPKASEENEHTTTCITTQNGSQVLFRQHAGTFARRIVNYARVGMDVKRGEQCGIIKFGSRMDIYLPLDSELMVKKGDRVEAVNSVIARLR